MNVLGKMAIDLTKFLDRRNDLAGGPPRAERLGERYAFWVGSTAGRTTWWVACTTVLPAEIRGRLALFQEWSDEPFLRFADTVEISLREASNASNRD